MRKLHKIT